MLMAFLHRAAWVDVLFGSVGMPYAPVHPPRNSALLTMRGRLKAL